MSARATVVLVLLTTVYLSLELGFNARLLDALGTSIEVDQIHNLERCGRALSGAALALLLLQLAIHSRARLQDIAGLGSAGGFWCMTALVCGVAATGVYLSLDRYTESLVDDSTGGFRRASMTAVLVKDAMLGGDIRLGNLPDQDALFSAPEGKAFLALFPRFAVSMTSLKSEFGQDEKVQLARKVSRKLGGQAAYYATYRKAVNATFDKWKRYDRAAPQKMEVMLEQRIATEQDRAWNQYLRDLGKHGWSPYTVPYQYHDRVRAKLRARVPVAPDWNLTDEAGLRDAVARKVRDAAQSRANTTSMKVNGRTIPLGLGWESFFAQPAIQSALRDQLHLPQGGTLRLVYASGTQFDREVFQPALDRVVGQQWPAYLADSSAYADGGRFESVGRSAARAVIVPPVALFFSLLGALTHMTKLACMICYASLRAIPGGARWTGWAIGAIFLVAGIGIAGLTLADNAFTRSTAYLLLERKIVQSSSAPLQAAMMARALHGVAVGQGFLYPVNEAIRTHVLDGLTYGFHPAEIPPS